MAAATAASSTTAQAAVQVLAHQRFVEAFAMQSSRSQISLVLTSSFIAWIWYRSVPGPWPLVWLAVVTAVSLWRHARTRSLLSGGDFSQSTRRVAVMLLVSGALQAVPLLEFAALSDAGRAVLTLTLVVLSTVSVVTTSGFRGVFMAFAMPMLLPLMLAWWLYGSARGDYVLAGLGPMMLPYAAFLYAVGKHANGVFMESCTYRFGEQQRNLELQRALAEADEANRAKTQFLAAASHDLRQPIHSMNVLVAALSLRPLDGPTKEIVGLLGNVNQTLSKQLDTLLDVSKLDAGVVRAELSPHPLDAIVRAHHAAIAPLAAQRGLQLTLHTDEELWVHTDAALLSRALSNLSDNAIKYTPTGGTVHLAARRDGAHALLQVRDSGIGIPAEEQERVFREFYQVGNVERDRSKGLGLGLSIVKRLCKLLAIELQLESVPGAGTTITLRMPQTPARPALAANDEAMPRRTQGLRVLVIDDEAMVRDSMRLLLQELQCKVYLAEGVAEGARIAAAEPLDLVLSDLRLRGGDSGLAAVDAVRQHQPALPAVLITGDTAPERIRDVQAAGVPLLFKPVTLDDLVAVLPQPR